MTNLSVVWHRDAINTCSCGLCRATLPVGMDETSLSEASQALDEANHNRWVEHIIVGGLQVHTTNDES